MANSTKLLSQKDFLKRCTEYPEAINYDFSNMQYKNIRSDVEVECTKHGKFTVNATQLMTGNGCRLCKKHFNPSSRNKLTLEEYTTYASELHNNRYDYSLITEDNFNNEKLPIKCNDHGVFFARKSAHISPGQVYGCSKCARGYSKNEERIEKWLKENNIDYTHQKTYDNLIGGRNQKLPFDFYIHNLNLLLEFDGRHHYEPVKFNKKQADEDILINFKQGERTDKIKNTYAFDNGIDIIRISYHRVKDIEKILGYELLGIACNIETPIITYRADDLGNMLPGKHIDYSYR